MICTDPVQVKPKKIHFKPVKNNLRPNMISVIYLCGESKH
jgi:hypothetical protein